MVLLGASVEGHDYVVTRVGSQPGDHDSNHPLVMTGLRHATVQDAERVADTGVPRTDHNGNPVFVDRSRYDLEVVEEGLFFPHLDTGSDVECIICKLIEK